MIPISAFIVTAGIGAVDFYFGGLSLAHRTEVIHPHRIGESRGCVLPGVFGVPTRYYSPTTMLLLHHYLEAEIYIGLK